MSNVTPTSGSDAEAPIVGGTRLDPATRERMIRRHMANPDDPPVPRLPRNRQAPMSADAAGSPGRVAIVQGQVYLVGVILIAQLFLVTTALYELLSGRTGKLWGIAAVSLAGFALALLITLWPRRRVKGF